MAGKSLPPEWGPPVGLNFQPHGGRASGSSTVGVLARRRLCGQFRNLGAAGLEARR